MTRAEEIDEHGPHPAFRPNECACGAVIHDESQFRAHVAMSGAVGNVRLTGDEREAIENAWIIAPKGGPSGDDDPMYLAVERILAARLADSARAIGGDQS